jgi:hypothetical protein
LVLPQWRRLFLQGQHWRNVVALLVQHHELISG